MYLLGGCVLLLWLLCPWRPDGNDLCGGNSAGAKLVRTRVRGARIAHGTPHTNVQPGEGSDDVEDELDASRVRPRLVYSATHGRA